MAVYVVRPGDTLSGIAARAGTTVAEILALNPFIEDPDVILVGWSLNLPGDHAPGRENELTGDVPWYQAALEELAHNVMEFPGEASNNPRILEYHASCTLQATNDETPWCSAFVNWCVEQANFKGTDSAAARSWLTWSGGTRIESPRVGAITVLRRGEPWQGHVGFFVSEDDSHVTLLGGNQSDAVSKASHRKDRVLAYIMPA